MKHVWTKPFKKTEHSNNCNVSVNNRLIGEFNDKTEGVVIDNVLTKERQHQVKPIRTEKVDFFVGLSTVAVFRIISRKHICEKPQIIELKTLFD